MFFFFSSNISVGFNNFDPDWRRALTDRPARHVFFFFSSNISVGFNNFDPDWRRALTDRPARHVFFSFLIIFQLGLIILIPTEGERWPTDLLGKFFFFSSNTSVGFDNFESDRRRALTDRPARHVFFSFLIIFQLGFDYYFPNWMRALTGRPARHIFFLF